MSFKSENWKEILQQVRTGIQENTVVKTEDDIISEEIDALLENFDVPVLQEVTDKEVDALKKLSKDMQSVLKGYQSIVKMGDKELKDSKYNKDYEAVLKARDTIFTLIGKVNTQKILNKEEVEVEKESTAEEVIEALEKDISVGKLTEKNMLGRLAKSMELNEENKTKLFDYFDKGELEQ
jgi:predicted transcriptional regulator|tara:strand:+ start:4143 stop:4682 length:540 start_codon:yes stop_codon:yes gene_type:complete